MWSIISNPAREDGKYVAEVSASKLVLTDGQGLEVKTIRIPSDRIASKADGSKWLVTIAQDPDRSYLTYYKASSELSPVSDSDSDSARLESMGFKVSGASAEESVEEVPVSAPTSEKKFEAYMQPLKLRFLQTALDMKSNVFLVGPKGCGKSTIAKAIAKYRDCQFFEFDMSQAIKPKKFFIGGMQLDGDHTTLVRSEFFKAYTSDQPTVLFLDELTRIPDQASNYLMTMLSKGESYIYDEDSGMRYYRGANVSIIAAGNFGAQYLGTSLLDSAFLDRFVKIHVDYPEASDEIALIAGKVKGVSKTVLSQLVKAANILRKSNKEDGISQTLSTRTLIDCAAFVKSGISLSDTIQAIIIEGYLDPDDQKLATQLLAGL